MRKGVIASTALHVGIIGATMVAWPTATYFSDEPPPHIPIELVTVAERTNIAPTVRRGPEPAPPPREPVPIQAQIAHMPLQVAEVAPPPEPEPPPPEPEPEPAAPSPEPEPRPVEQVRDVPPAAPLTPVIPRARPQPERPQQFDVDSVLALLDQRSPRSPPPSAPVGDATVRGIGAQNALTVDIRDALLAQMRECWNVPVGAPRSEELIVQVRVFLTRDGNLAQPPQLTPESRAAAGSNSYMRTASEAALRAINVCAPYRNLPAERYDAWREIVMIFDPSRMTGR